jgi:hypothetical protein
LCVPRRVGRSRAVRPSPVRSRSGRSLPPCRSGNGWHLGTSR